MKATSTLFSEILLRTMSKETFSPSRSTPICTCVLRGPRIRRTIESCGMPTPAIGMSLTFTIRSPESTPTLSAGPPAITLLTTAVSSGTENWMPIPKNSPISDSSALWRSLGER